MRPTTGDTRACRPRTHRYRPGQFLSARPLTSAPDEVPLMHFETLSGEAHAANSRFASSPVWSTCSTRKTDEYGRRPGGLCRSCDHCLSPIGFSTLWLPGEQNRLAGRRALCASHPRAVVARVRAERAAKGLLPGEASNFVWPAAIRWQAGTLSPPGHSGFLNRAKSRRVRNRRNRAEVNGRTVKASPRIAPRFGEMAVLDRSSSTRSTIACGPRHANITTDDN